MLVTWLAGLPSAVVTGLVALAVVGVVALGLLVGVRHWVLRLDDARLPGPGAALGRRRRSARWTDVLDLQATTVAGQRCVVLRLRDGRTTTLPVDVIEGGPTALTEALTDHLDRGPRLPPPALSGTRLAESAARIFRGGRGWVTCALLVREVSPSPVYGARLLSGLRVVPSRGFKSRHLRRLTAPDPRVRGGRMHACETCMIMQCTLMRLLTIC